MDKTLEQLRLLFAEIATKHKQVNSFFWGDFNRATSEETLDYPLLLVDTVNAQITRNGIAFTFQITIADSVLKGYENLNETFDDTLLVLKDVLDTMRSPKWQTFSTMQDSSTAERFYQRGADEVAGWYVRQVLQIHSPKDLCSIPFDNYDFDGTFVSNCEPVEIYENGILVDTVESGGSYSYSTVCADGTANVNKSDGTLISAVTVPSGSTIPYNVADSTVKSTGSAYSSTVKATETFTIPDVSFTQTDGSPTTAEYGSSIVCSPATEKHSSEIYRTGQTTSYRTGDDGDTEYGNGSTFYSLGYDNGFGGGNQARFTDINGNDWNGVGASGNIILDWANWDRVNDKVAVWNKNANGNNTWDNQIDWGLVDNLSTGYTGWHLHNQLEALGIVDSNLAQLPTFFGGPSNDVWTSTTNANSTTQAMYLRSGFRIDIRLKTNVESGRQLAYVSLTTLGI